ncbi:MAG: SGNH/GDSL hydrolase family protein [Crocinitomicaceae bacterium]|nr:SGNH/GDSL hydrolase family protein [Crocinitomicaceae bacterium]
MSSFTSSCTSSDKRIGQNNKIPYTYLALGDSYTIGESVSESERWPVQLVSALNKKGIKVEEPRIIAKTGWRTDDMLNAAKSELDSTQQFEMVSLLIGVNNEYQGWAPEEFEPEFEACLDFAISKCKNGVKGVFVVSIPDYGYTPFGKKKQKQISERLKIYNSICKKVSKEKGVTFYNITPISQSNPDDITLVAKDGLHPSGKQYGMWVDSFIDSLYKQLSSITSSSQ